MPDRVCPLSDAEARAALAMVRAFARRQRQWDLRAPDRAALDLSEYEDAGLDAFLACLRTYDPARGPLASYLRAWLRGAMQDAVEHYCAWHFRPPVPRARRPRQTRFKPPAWALRPVPPSVPETAVLVRECLAALPPDAHAYAALVLEGYTDTEIAARWGLTKSGLCKRIRRWRAAVHQGR